MINGYVAIYKGKSVEVRGEGLTLWEAKKQAIQKLQVPRKDQHLVSIMLAEQDGQPVVHKPDF